MLAAVIPNNLFTYATSDISYVENVQPTLDVPSIELGAMDVTVVNQRFITNDKPKEMAIMTLKSTNLTDANILIASENTEGAHIENVEQLITKEEVEETIEDKIIEEEVIEEVEEVQSEQEEVIEEVEVEPIITPVDQSDALVNTEIADESYTGCKVELTPEDRDLLERLVQGEAGGEGYEGAALVAQAIRDTIVYKGYSSVAEVRTALKYSGSIKNPPNDNVKAAVAYIFDDGGIAVKHKIFYFYAPKYCAGEWHETQLFVVEHKGHKFFSNHE